MAGLFVASHTLLHTTLTIYRRYALDYLVKNGSLPNVTFPLNRTWAGSITVNRTNHPNDTLFFWAFEHTNGSLTSNATDEPWAIWLNGG